MTEYRRKYGITNKKLSKYLGYSNVKSFLSSSSRHRIWKGIDLIIKDIEDTILGKIKET